MRNSTIHNAFDYGKGILRLAIIMSDNRIINGITGIDNDACFIS